MGFARMFRSSPRRTARKNRMFTGLTQRSRRSISSSEVGQMLQNTVPAHHADQQQREAAVDGSISKLTMEGLPSAAQRPPKGSCAWSGVEVDLQLVEQQTGQRAQPP